MLEVAGKAAFVTGGACGIGLALGRTFAEAGMRVMLGDIEEDVLVRAANALRDDGLDVHAVRCDVANAASVECAAEAAQAALGNIHVLCNNAGVAGGSGVDEISADTWRWVIDVNLMGLVHGIDAFLPRMRAHGEGGHIVNTASMAGLVNGMGFSPYAASKFAVVAMSEGLAEQLRALGIGVTVVCPGFVRTRIAESARNRPSRYGPPPVPHAAGYAARLAAIQAELGESGIDPAEVAAQVLDAIRAGDLYVFTHADDAWRIPVEKRFGAILAAIEAAAAREVA